MRRHLTLVTILVAVGAAAAPVWAGTPGPAPTLVTGKNLLVNPGGENGAAAASVTGAATPPPGWTVTGGFSEVTYGAADFPDASDAKAVAGGAHFLAGGPGDRSVSTATQVVDVSADAARIDGAGVYASLRAALGGFGLQRDYGVVDALFRDSGGKLLGQLRVGPVTVDDRGGLPVGGFQGYGHTELVERNGVLRVPAGTRSIAVVLSSVRLRGTYGDGYFDNVGLALTGPRTVAPPAMARTLTASVVRGRVLVREPGTRRPHALSGTRLLPMHSLIDTRNGVARISTAANRLGEIQTGDFRAGEFTVAQRAARRPFTLLTLHGGDLATCATGTRASAARRRGRRLFGRSRGHFRSRGRNSSATTRGTSWTTADTCAGTATDVEQGKIDIHDFKRNAVVPIARGVEPDLSAHDAQPTPGCTAPCATAPSPSPPGRRASSHYVAGGGR